MSPLFVKAILRPLGDHAGSLPVEISVVGFDPSGLTAQIDVELQLYAISPFVPGNEPPEAAESRKRAATGAARTTGRRRTPPLYRLKWIAARPFSVFPAGTSREPRKKRPLRGAPAPGRAPARSPRTRRGRDRRRAAGRRRAAAPARG